MDRKPEECCWGESMGVGETGEVLYWCALGNVPCRYATGCSFEKKEDDDNVMMKEEVIDMAVEALGGNEGDAND